MAIRKLSNLYNPCIAKRLTVSSFHNFNYQRQKSDRNEDEEMSNDDIPIGIINSWKTNDLNKSLIQAFNIKQYENVEALKIIEEEIKKVDEEPERYWTPDSCIMQDLHFWTEGHSWISAEGWEIIYLWRTTRLLLSSIAFKTNTKHEEATVYIAAYKKKVRQQLKL